MLLVLITPLIFFSLTMVELVLLIVFLLQNSVFSNWVEDFTLMDKNSYWLLALVIWLFMIIKMKINSNFEKSFYVNMLMLFLVLILVFILNNIFYFYIMYEFALIPIFLLLMGWGYHPERLQASMFMFFYTLSITLPMMLSFFIFSTKLKSFDLSILNLFKSENSILMMVLVLGMLVKFPIYFLHFWLPKAHVQAPVVGSMILAAILLKLGGYGLLRVTSIFSYFSKTYALSVIIMGGMISALISIRQSDSKMLVAYSSIGHMGMVAMGYLSFLSMGVSGSLMMMLGHGLCSSGLFLIVDSAYQKLKSRMFFLIRGLGFCSVSMFLYWFLLSVSNMASPPSLNLPSEVLLMMVGLNLNLYFIMLILLLSFLTALFCLFLFLFTFHGFSNKSVFEVSVKSSLLLFLHWAPLNLLILILTEFFLLSMKIFYLWGKM